MLENTCSQTFAEISLLIGGKLGLRLIDFYHRWTGSHEITGFCCTTFYILSDLKWGFHAEWGYLSKTTGFSASQRH